MPNKLLPLLLLAPLTATAVSARDIEARFTTDKANYLSGEPVFVTLTVNNRGNEPIWVDFKSPDMPLLCHDFAVEVSEAQSAHKWGCGAAGSCGRSFKEVSPGASITLWQLLNREFRLQRLGAYTVHGHTTMVVHNQNLSESSIIDQFEVSDTLTVKVQRSNEGRLKAAFQPYVEELNSPDPMKRSQAAVAITELAPPFLEDALVELTKSSYAYAAISALRKADTLKTREALAQIATGTGDSMLRIEAIRNLGRTNDPTYLPTLFQLMGPDNKQVQNAAAQAAGNLGGPAAVPQLAALVSSSDAETRSAGANGLGDAHASQAVPILIGLLLDSDANVRQAAVSGLWLLTHRAAFENNQWPDVSSPESSAAVHLRWVRWWNSHRSDSEIHGLTDCAPARSLE